MEKQFASGSKGFKRSNDRTRLIYIAAVGLSFSLMTLTMLVVNYKQDANAKESKSVVTPIDMAGSGSIPLYVPERPIPAGAKLSDFSFKEAYWPRNQVPDGAVFELSEIKNRYAKANIPAGVPVIRTNLTDQMMVRQSLPLTPGNRAISIEVDEISGLEGHALPGTRVDILLSYYEDRVLKTEMIVQNARVLSYGGEVKPAYSQESSVPTTRVNRISRSITVEVSPRDAMKIHTARQLGRLGLIMRSEEDNKTPEVTELDQFEIGTSHQAKAADKGCSKGTVRMQNGSEYVVGCDGTINQVMNTREP